MTLLVRVMLVIALMTGGMYMVYGQHIEKQYIIAKKKLHQKEYKAAIRAFELLNGYVEEENPYKPYILFYYAVSYYYALLPLQAKDLFLEIKRKYDGWQNKDEVYYWLGKLYFDQRQYFQAMKYLDDITDLSLQKDVEEMKFSYLTKIGDREILRMIQEEHARDTIAAEALVRAIIQGGFYEKDKFFVDSLVTQFNLVKQDCYSTSHQLPLYKDNYQVSLLFPFMFDNVYPNLSSKVNQGVLDLYHGIQMARDELDANDNIQIELNLFDNQRDIEVTKQLLNDPVMKKSDVIVGPLFSRQIAVAQEFSKQHCVNVIHPISGDASYVPQNLYTLVATVDYKTIGVRSAEWMDAYVMNNTCMVFLDEQQKSTVMAQGFVERAKELSLNVVYTGRFSSETSYEIYDLLATPIEFDELDNPVEFSLKKDSIGCVFVASEDPLVYTKIISAIDLRGDRIFVVGHQSWLNDPPLAYDIYERLQVAFAGPHFYAPDNEHYQTFYKSYIQKHAIYPSIYASMGYEFMFFLGQCLNRYGVYFQQALGHQDFVPGRMIQQYSYKNARSNQLLPFLLFEQGELISFVRDNCEDDSF